MSDMVGRRFGKLTVVSQAKHSGKNSNWNCLCECGNTTTVCRPNLMGGHTSSCGCLTKRRGQEHPLWKATVKRYRKTNGVSEHRAIAAKTLGGDLPPGAVIHHVNGDKADNRNCNLVICNDENYHRHIHKRAAAYINSGNPDWVKCNLCKEYDDPANLYMHKPKSSAWHRECMKEYRENRKNGRR